jgi:hypothetical protein
MISGRSEHGDNMAEWLRRQPAKLMGYARVGSNPTVVVISFLTPSHEVYSVYTMLHTVAPANTDQKGLTIMRTHLENHTHKNTHVHALVGSNAHQHKCPDRDLDSL